MNAWLLAFGASGFGFRKFDAGLLLPGTVVLQDAKESLSKSSRAIEETDLNELPSSIGAGWGWSAGCAGSARQGMTLEAREDLGVACELCRFLMNC